MPLSIRHAQPLLASIASWRLTQAEWAQVGAALDAFAAALDADDARAAGAALAALAIVSDRARPSRPLKPELDRPETSPDPKVTILADRLVHRLLNEAGPPPAAGTP